MGPKLQSRGGRIRTDDLLRPRQTRYQTALRPVFEVGLLDHALETRKVPLTDGVCEGREPRETSRASAGGDVVGVPAGTAHAARARAVGAA